MANSEYYKKLNIAYWVFRNRIDKQDVKYYNLFSIENFIEHFDELDDEIKAEAYERINNYLVHVQGINSFNIREHSKKLYFEFILPIAQDYYSSFSIFGNWYAVYALLIGVLLILFLLGVSSGWYYLVLIFFAIFHFRMLHKKIKKKVYGFKY